MIIKVEGEIKMEEMINRINKYYGNEKEGGGIKEIERGTEEGEERWEGDVRKNKNLIGIDKN
jgi:hypothetical protein